MLKHLLAQWRNPAAVKRLRQAHALFDQGKFAAAAMAYGAVAAHTPAAAVFVSLVMTQLPRLIAKGAGLGQGHDIVIEVTAPHVAESTNSGPVSKPSRMLPGLLIAGGLVAAAAGGVLLYYGSLRGPDNLVAWTTARYHDRPMVVRGPGAGVEVTASAVLFDLLALG